MNFCYFEQYYQKSMVIFFCLKCPNSCRNNPLSIYIHIILSIFYSRNIFIPEQNVLSCWGDIPNNVHLGEIDDMVQSFFLYGSYFSSIPYVRKMKKYKLQQMSYLGVYMDRNLTYQNEGKVFFKKFLGGSRHFTHCAISYQLRLNICS